VRAFKWDSESILEKKKDARAGLRVKITFYRIIIIASNYDAEKSGFHAESRACVLFSPPGYSQNPIFKRGRCRGVTERVSLQLGPTATMSWPEAYVCKSLVNCILY